MNFHTSRFAKLCIVTNSINMTIFYTLEVVGRGSEARLQVSEKINYLTWRFILCNIPSNLHFEGSY